MDASALLAFLDDEPGAEIVREAHPAAISAVNFGEVVAKMAERGTSEAAIRAILEAFPVEVVPFDKDQALAAGMLRPATKSLVLSFGDRGCLALAKRLGVPALTTERLWASLSPSIATIRLIR